MRLNEPDAAIIDIFVHPGPDEAEGDAAWLGETGSESCACLLSESSMLGSLARDFYSQVWK